VGTPIVRGVFWTAVPTCVTLEWLGPLKELSVISVEKGLNLVSLWNERHAPLLRFR
jgi:hypothetical protein